MNRLVGASIGVLLLCAFSLAQTTAAPIANPPQRPLTSLPYTPSLDVPSMDKATDPCTDFYTYSCGGWNKANPIPADQAAWDVYSKLADENRTFLWGILEEAAKPSSKRTPVDQKIGDFFASCMDEAAIEKAGAAPLKKGLAAIDELRSKSSLAALLANMKMTGSGSAFRFESSQDYKDSSRVIAFLDQGGIGLPDRDYYTKDDAKSKELREKYIAHVAQMFALLGEAADRAKSDADTVMRMETALAKASLTRVQRRDPHNLDHKMTDKQLVELAPEFDWEKYFADSGLPSPSELNVTAPDFYKELNTELTNVSLEDWKTYLRWKLVHSEAPYLSSKFVQADFDFYRKTLRGVTEMQPRWKRCVGLVDQDLGDLGPSLRKKDFRSRGEATNRRHDPAD